MRFHSVILALLACAQAAAPAAWAQSAGSGLALCDPFLNAGDDNEDEGDEEELERIRVLYDQEVAQPLTSEAEVMDAIYEERWDPASGDAVPRTELCGETPTYVVNWARVIGPDESGAMLPLAEGLFRLRKDMSFEFVFADRPYVGNWVFADGQMTLTAPWLNGGDPLAGPVELVRTPVEYTRQDGTTDTYNEEAYRVGPFRLQPVATTVPGAIQDCACPAN